MSAHHHEVTPDLVDLALSFIPPDIGHDERVRVAFAVFDGLGASGGDAWKAWAGRRQNPSDAEDAATWRSGLMRSRDGGRDWERVDTAGPGDDDQRDFTYIYSLASDGARLALATDAGLSASVDGGESWRHSYFNSGLLSVVFDRDGVLWGTSKTGVWRCDLASMEADEGRIDGFGWSPLDYFSDLYRGAGGDLIGARRNALHRLAPRDGGYRMEGASLSNVEALALLPLSGGGLLLGTSRGFFRSEEIDFFEQYTLPIPCPNLLTLTMPMAT